MIYKGKDRFTCRATIRYDDSLSKIMQEQTKLSSQIGYGVSETA